MIRGLAFALAACAGLCVMRSAAEAEWQPPDVHRTTVTLAEVLARNAKATGTGTAPSQRRERWTYANGAKRFSVAVAVRGDDFRADIDLAGATYAAGRFDGVRWRADANGIAHATLSDDQGDAVDRLPQSVFPIHARDLRLAGDSNRFGAAWVLADRPVRDKPHWLYVDATTGLIEHEITREGSRTIVTAFRRFENVGGMLRPREWHVSNGDPAQDLNVTVDEVKASPVGERDVAVPQEQRTFAAPSSAGSVVRLPVHFRNRTIFVDGEVDGRRTEFILDTGTASIVLDRRLTTRYGALLEHASIPKISAGDLSLADASVLSLPLSIGYDGLGGILGYDFFFGHVVHVDYAHQRVEIMTHDAAESVFHDRSIGVIDAYFDEGVPLVNATFGPATGSRFALDSGSPHLFVLEPFVKRYAREIDAHWTRSLFPGGRRLNDEVYLEGSIVVSARQVPSFTLDSLRFTDLLVGVQEPNDRGDAIDIPLDGIIGTDEMAKFEWWFDYDGGRIALRRNETR